MIISVLKTRLYIKSKNWVTDLDGSGRDNTNVLSGMSGATENNHEHHVAIGRVALGIRTPPIHV